jgi:exodeoxyribonuclease-3
MLTEFVLQFLKFIEWLKQVNPDVVCLQEIKASGTTSVIGFRMQDTPIIIGFSYKKGYSGVAILSK